MKHLKEYVVFKDKKTGDEIGGYWYRKMVSDVADFYYDSEITHLGSGAYGDVYIFNNYPSKVLKITTDESEIPLIERMRKLPELHHVINYYDVRRIKSEKNSRMTYWAILMDRIIPIKQYKKGIYKDIYEDYTAYIESDDDYNIGRSRLLEKIKTTWSWENFWKDNKDNYDPNFNKRNKLTEEQIKNFILQYQETILELDKYKLLFLSDNHAGNVGFKTNGDFCFYDMMGESDSSKIKLKPIKTT